MADPTQKYRDFGITSPLGPDVLLFHRMTGSERLGGLFEYEVDMLSTQAALPPDKLLGQPLTVGLKLPNHGHRYFNGIVTRFGQYGTLGTYACYRATLRPWFWLLTRTTDCRIFQEKTVPEIIEEIFQENGLTDFEKILARTAYPKREYCVQYRETRFNFLSRLMEEEGIYYYFKHENGKHRMVLADAHSAHGAFPGYATIPYFEPGNPRQRERDHIFEWAFARQVLPSTCVLMDFDFKKPGSNLEVRAKSRHKPAPADFEWYDYPGLYRTPTDGEHYVENRLQAFEAEFEQISGRGSAEGLAAGALFKLTGHRRQDQNREYLITSVSFLLQSDEYLSSLGGTATEPCRFEFTAIDGKQPFRSPRRTPKPLMHGPQTALVVGKEGEEIWTDSFGRVKVRFHWDRRAGNNEKASCWIRVAQSWAGKRWGTLFLPRRGQEVIVEFLEGDPDQPIVTGTVYNGDQMPPYALPGEATKSTFKSDSSKGGGGFNEIRFEDQKGKEQVFIHAERNHDLRVKKDALEWIGQDRHLIVKRDQIEKVDGDKHGNVTGDHNEKVGGAVSLSVGTDFQQKAGANYALEAGQSVHIKGGMNVVIEAGMSVTLKAGGGFIVVGPAGVTISGTPVLINSGGSAGSGAGCSPDTPKAPTEADDGKPGETPKLPPPKRPPKPFTYSPAAQVLLDAARDGTPFCEICNRS
jgi:type VI secretion system secreted protein VgrG